MKVNALPTLKGYIEITKSALIAKLGLPYIYSKQRKRQCMWQIEYSTGELVNIHDYDSRTKLWKISSDYESALERIKHTFPSHKVSERLTKNKRAKFIVATPYGKLKLNPEEQWCDIGNNIGYSLGLDFPMTESECEELIHGIRHGISLTNGTH